MNLSSISGSSSYGSLIISFGSIMQGRIQPRLYLKILFEDEIPAREELIRRMRLFSAEYFGPALEQAKDRGNIRRDLPAASVIFLLDAVIERFLQGCARSYLDSGLGLSRMDEESLEREIEILIGILKRGLLADDGRA